MFGSNLIVPAAAGSEDLDPTVTAGSWKATVSNVTRTAGGDRLDVTLPGAVPDNQPLMLSVVRADGVVAQGPGGAPGVPVTVLPKPQPPPP